MRDEELDWEIYHAILGGKILTVADIEAAGCDRDLIEGSLRRLERALLIKRRGDEVRPLSFQESILLCQIMNGDESPLFLENGIIRVKTGEERKE